MKKNFLEWTELELPQNYAQIEEAIERCDLPEKKKNKTMMFKYIESLGGVRKDVFEYLLQADISNKECVHMCTELFNDTSIGVGWYQLMIDGIPGKAKTGNLKLWGNGILKAIKEHMPKEVVENFLNSSDTPFHFNYMISNYLEMQKAETDEIEKTVGDISEYEVKLEHLEADKQFLEKQNKELLQETIVLRQKLGKALVEGDILDENKKLKEQVEDFKKLLSMAMQEKDDSNEMVKEESILDGSVHMVDIQKQTDISVRRGKLFASLIKGYQQRQFEKKSEEEQKSLLFQMMVDHSYGKKRILAVKKWMEEGVSLSLIYLLILKNPSEEEFYEVLSSMSKEANE